MSLKTRANEIINSATFEPTPDLFIDIVGYIEAGVIVASDTLNAINITSDGGDVTFPKVTAPNASNFIYRLYSSSIESDVSSVDTIESSVLQSTGTDVETLSFTGPDGEVIYLGVLFEDPLTGFKGIYTPIFEFLPEGANPPTGAPEITSVSETSEGVLVAYDTTNVDLGPWPSSETGYKLTVTLNGVDTVIDIGDSNPGLFPNPTQGETYELTVRGYNPDGDGPESDAVGYKTNVYGEVTATTSFTTA